MTSNYAELRETIDEMKETLKECFNTLDDIQPNERQRYDNPKYRMWSGDIKDLDGFIDRLEEWLNQPSVAEAKRCMLNIKKWSEIQEKISIEEIEKDWKFLSDNVKEIITIHDELQSIGYLNIKTEGSTWALKRIIEKDITRALNWATNANKYHKALKTFEYKGVQFDLTREVKNDSVIELSKVTSFDKYDDEKILKYKDLVDKAENMVRNKAEEISERSLLKTYGKQKKNMELEENITEMLNRIEEIKKHLIKLEWVKPISNHKDYKRVWQQKQNIMEKSTYKSSLKALKM